MPTLQSEFGGLLRHWRESRRLSQLDLALEANVSSKHVSFLETGRNRPSRDMILRLSQVLEVPLRDRNTLLDCAGFAPIYRQSALDSPQVDQAKEAIARILEKQDPYPAIVLDADWMLVQQNRGAGALGQLFLGDLPAPTGNALEVLFSADGLQPFVSNWEQLSAIILMRLYRDTLSPAASEYSQELFERLLTMPTTPDNWREIAGRLPTGPTVDMVLEKDDLRLSFFTTITTFGTAQDITLQELRIESYFPSDEVTRELCAGW